MSTTTKPIKGAVESILSKYLPDDYLRSRRLGRLRVPLYVVDYCPDLMKAIMADIELHHDVIGDITISGTYRAEKSGYQYYWGISDKFEIVYDELLDHWPRYELVVRHVEEHDFYTFEKLDK